MLYQLIIQLIIFITQKITDQTNDRWKMAPNYLNWTANSSDIINFDCITLFIIWCALPDYPTSNINFVIISMLTRATHLYTVKIRIDDSDNCDDRWSMINDYINKNGFNVPDNDDELHVGAERIDEWRDRKWKTSVKQRGKWQTEHTTDAYGIDLLCAYR